MFSGGIGPCLPPIGMPNISQTICLSETRLRQTPLINIHLPEYKLPHADFPTLAGGVAIYFANSMDAEFIPDVCIDVDGCENVWLKLNSANIVIGVIYRHPKNSTKTFLESLNKIFGNFYK